MSAPDIGHARLERNVALAADRHVRQVGRAGERAASRERTRRPLHTRAADRDLEPTPPGRGVGWAAARTLRVIRRAASRARDVAVAEITADLTGEVTACAEASVCSAVA